MTSCATQVVKAGYISESRGQVLGRQKLTDNGVGEGHRQFHIDQSHILTESVRMVRKTVDIQLIG